MNIKKIKGLKIANQFLKQISQKVTKFQQKHSLPQQMKQPRLGIILVGDHPASLSYIKRKRTCASQANIKSRLFQIKDIQNISSNTLSNELQKIITKLNQDIKYHGILLQLPLPNKIIQEQNKFLDMIIPQKDVDCLGTYNRNIFQKYGKKSQIIPCVVQAVLRMLDDKKIKLHNKNILILGKGRLAGNPLSSYLQHQKFIYKSADENTSQNQLKQMINQADIIFTGTGKQDIIEQKYFKKGCVIIDIGCSPDLKNPGKVRGDFSQQLKQNVCSYYSPVPKGVGPLSVASLINNVYKTWKIQALKK